MQTARFFSPVHTLGPGRRVGLWTQGCRKKCPECTAPELQIFRKELEIPEEILARMIMDAARRNGCSGLTISGGDPFEQPESLLKLLKLLRETFEDILVYTGYTMEEIRAGAAAGACTEAHCEGASAGACTEAHCEGASAGACTEVHCEGVAVGEGTERRCEGASADAGIECLRYIDVLIDGRYVPSLNDPSCTLRGSSNQKIWYLTPGMEEKYAGYLAAGRKVENFIHQDHVVTVGIQNRGET